MKKYIVFLDMDGPLANFDEACKDSDPTKDPPEMYVPGFYRNLKVVPGAHYAVHAILAMKHVELFIGSKPSSGMLGCASEKFEWIAINFPKMLKRIVLACDKGLLKGDILVDDCPELWKHKFDGIFYTFDKKNPEKCWLQIVDMLNKLQ